MHVNALTFKGSQLVNEVTVKHRLSVHAKSTREQALEFVVKITIFACSDVVKSSEVEKHPAGQSPLYGCLATSW